MTGPFFLSYIWNYLKHWVLFSICMCFWASCMCLVFIFIFLWHECINNVCVYIERTVNTYTLVCTIRMTYCLSHSFLNVLSVFIAIFNLYHFFFISFFELCCMCRMYFPVVCMNISHTHNVCFTVSQVSLMAV